MLCLTGKDLSNWVPGQGESSQVVQTVERIQLHCLQQVVAQIQFSEILKSEICHVLEIASRQDELDEVEVAGQVSSRHTRTTGVKVTELRVLLSCEWGGASESEALTQALLRTSQITEPLVILLQAVENAVAHVVSVQTDPGAAAAVVPGTWQGVTPQLVLTPGAVLHLVTAQEQGQAVPRRTLEVGRGTCLKQEMPLRLTTYVCTHICVQADN